MSDKQKAERFKYNSSLEAALQNLMGEQYRGHAGTFANWSHAKRSSLKALNRIRRRLDEVVTTDDRLLLTTRYTLDGIESHVKETTATVNNDWFIIGDLLLLVSYLLGYDWADGRIHHNVVYHQDKSQERENYEKMRPGDFWRQFPGEDVKIRYKVVRTLKKEGLDSNQIARVMGFSEHIVKKMLRTVEYVERQTGQAFDEVIGGLRITQIWRLEKMCSK